MDSFNNDIYFAAQEPEKVAEVVLDRADSFFKNFRQNYYLAKLVNNWRAYHGVYTESNGLNGGGHEISFGGEQGELLQIPVNHFRNLARHMFNMITANRPAMQAQAINTDYKSISQTKLAEGVLDYYMRQKRLEDALKKACEMAIVLGTGYLKLEWNATAGDLYDQDEETGEKVHEGELEFANLSPFDVVIDGTKEGWDNDWILVRTFKNRYNLMAKFPELAEKIRVLPSKSDENIYRYSIFSNDQTDDIPVYEFYHRKSEALPEGRYLQFLDTGIPLLDVNLPYTEIPIYRIVPGEIMGTPYGYTDMFDVFPLQDALNGLYSTILTNQNAFGVQNVFIQRGSDLEVSSLGGGLNVLEANHKPEPLNLTNTPAEVFKFLETMFQTSETISGINSVTRGNPEASLRSGNALALVQSMSLQFMSGLQQSYVKLIEDVGTAVVKILQLYANTPKVMAIVGKTNRPYLKEFIGSDIAQINRVVVQAGNPLSKTTAGRVQMAEQMMQMGIITNPHQYFQVIDTGTLDAMTEGSETELLLIKQENEQLIEGKSPIVSPLDSHKQHILEHRAVLADPDLRTDPSLVQIVMDHIESHMQMLSNTDPNLLAMIGEQAIQPPSPPAPPGAPQGQGGPQGQLQAPQSGPVQGGEQINSLNGSSQNLPNLPKVDPNLLPNPAIQEQAQNNLK